MAAALRQVFTIFRFNRIRRIHPLSQCLLIRHGLCHKPNQIPTQIKPEKENATMIPVKTVLHEEKTDTSAQDGKSMKYLFVAFGITFACIGGYLYYELGKPILGEDGHPIKDEYCNLPEWKQRLFRMLKEIEYYKRMIKEPSRDKLLPDVMTYPYYQPPYTLILELTDVLVHPDWTLQTGWRFKKRPGIDHFLETLNGMYEIVIYTAEGGMTVFPIVEALDPNNVISYKLVRDATHFSDGHHVKDLSRLNRDLKKVIVIDWNRNSVKFHPDNAFLIDRWSGNDDDSTLVDLAEFLRTIALANVDDVREVLRYYGEYDNPLGVFREKQKMLIELQEAERAKQGTPINVFKH